jgi:adenylate cyclase
MPRKPLRALQYKFSLWTFLIGIAVLAAIGTLNFFHTFDRIEYLVSDFRMYWRSEPRKPSTIKIAAIDDKSISELGHWPWSRDTLARFEHALIDYKVAVVGYDVLFSEQDSFDAARASLVDRIVKAGATRTNAETLIGKSNDQAFADAMKAQGKTVLAYSFGTLDAAGKSKGFIEQGFTDKVVVPGPLAYNLAFIPPKVAPQLYGSDYYRPPTQILNAAAHSTGYVPIDADADGVMRAQIMVSRFHDQYRVPLSLAVLRALVGDGSLKIDFNEHGQHNILLDAPDGELPIPVNEHGQMLVMFRGPEGTFPHYSISDIINRRIAPEDLAGKIVLVGATARGEGDRFNTPEGADFPGVEIHANAIDDIINNDVIVRTGDRELELFAGLVLGLVMVFAASILPGNLAAITAIFLSTTYAVFARRQLWGPDHRLIGIVYPILMIFGSYLVMGLYRYYEENKEKRFLRHAFEHYLHPSVIASVVDNPEGLKLGGERRVVSILFADIVNYTGLSERTDPVALVTMLNDYMTKMTDRILESEGVVDKIRGDGIMAFWGAPNSVPNHAQAAIDSALAMLTELKTLKKTDPRFATVDIGIGIATGEAIAGNFGGANRFDYSVIGDVVNLASRLEELTRKFKVHLIVSRGTVNQTNGAYIKRDIGLVRVKGKLNAIPVVEIAGHANDGVDPGFYDKFGHLSELLAAGDGDAARAELTNLQHEQPDDGVVHMYMEKFTELKELPREMLFEFDTK